MPAKKAAKKPATKKTAKKPTKTAAKKAIKQATKKSDTGANPIKVAKQVQSVLAEGSDPHCLACTGLPVGYTFYNEKGRLNVKVAASAVRKVDKIEVLKRTITMLAEEWPGVTEDQITSQSKLTSPPLNGNAIALGSLEVPIESSYFVDLEVDTNKILPDDLRDLATPPGSKKVADLRNLIWNAIPDKNKASR